MTSILSLLIVTLITGETLPGELMLSHHCRRDVIEARAIMDAMPAGAEIVHNTTGQAISTIECRPYRIGAGA